MTEYVFKVVDSVYKYWFVDDPTEILNEFGKVEQVTRYRLVDPVDITDAVNGGYLREDDYT